MKNVVAKYAKRLLLLTLVSGIVSLVLYFILPGTWFSPALPFLFVFYFGCSLISFMLLKKTLESRFGRFVSVFMLTTAVKLFLFIAIMIIYSFLNKQDAVAFLLNFFILYLIFTVFDVTQILGLTNKTSSAGNANA
jgi:hypothetical protein